MPGLDGVETVRRIRNEVAANIPILLISAYDWSDIEDQAKATGADGFISKPLFRSKVYEKINELLGVEAKSVEPEDDYSDLMGMRILVAEDNDINWEIISAMLAEGCIDMEVCKALEGNYDPVIMRFLEGDVPMMICSGDTVSGTRKRESQSEAYTKAPFTYTFLPVPLTEEGGIFLDRPSLQFSVNKDCENLDMTNEFMRFLITEPELNAISEAKRLVTPARDLSVDSIYAAFEQVPAKRIISPEALGIMDVTTVQLRGALFNVMNGSMTIDEAIAAYGSFEL